MPLLGSTPDPLPISTRKSASKQSTPALPPSATMFEAIGHSDPSDSLFGGLGDHNSALDKSGTDAFAATASHPTKPAASASVAKSRKPIVPPKVPAKSPASKAANGAADTKKESKQRGRANFGGKDANGNYEIAEILQERPNKDTGKPEFRVKWKGWSTRHNSWEPEENLSTAKDLLNEFRAAKKRIEEKRKTTTKKRAGYGEKWKNAFSRREKRTLRSGRK